MAFELSPLPYDYNALEPYIDTLTMQIHHDKHHAAYVTNLNKALEGAPELQDKSLEWLMVNLESLPEFVRTAVRNNGGGHINHTMFWEIMGPSRVAEGEDTMAKVSNFMESSFQKVGGWIRSHVRFRWGEGLDRPGQRGRYGTLRVRLGLGRHE